MWKKKERQRAVEALSLCIGLSEARDPGLSGNSVTVMELAVLLFDFLPLSLRFGISREELAYAALLADIGKLCIPESIRNKKGKLNDKERELLKNYPNIGADILKDIAGLKHLSDWVRYQHERVDGRGYYGLKGKDIPLASRILAVADTYSAITQPRLYRPNLSYEEAVEELRLAAGSQLDEALVNAFCEIPPRRVNECLGAVADKMKYYESFCISDDKEDEENEKEALD